MIYRYLFIILIFFQFSCNEATTETGVISNNAMVVTAREEASKIGVEILKFFNLTNKIIRDSLNDPIPKSGESEVIVVAEIKTPVLNTPRYLIDMPANITEVTRLINWEILIQKLYFNDSLSKFRVYE